LNNFKNPYDIKISYEVFPPKGDGSEKKINTLIGEMDKLKKFSPERISVTYGAGGSNSKNSLEIARRIKNELDIKAMPHFTCMCSSKQFIEGYIKEIEKEGFSEILALRGDKPKDIDACYNDFKYANELVEFLKEKTDLNISVAGYPEKHQDAKDIYTDIENLKRKVDAGAKTIYTQLFFDNTSFYKYMQLVRDAGVEIPVIPGILPITSFSGLMRMVDMCGVVVPKSLIERFEKYKDREKDIIELGIEFATFQCQELMDSGVSGIHFYTLNKAHSTSEILTNLL